MQESVLPNSDRSANLIQFWICVLYAFVARRIYCYDLQKICLMFGWESFFNVTLPDRRNCECDLFAVRFSQPPPCFL